MTTTEKPTEQLLSDAQLAKVSPMLRAYAGATEVSNDDLYQHIAKEKSLPPTHWNKRVPIGRSGALHSPARREIRWFQQSLRALGLIERVPGVRGLWRATDKLRSAPKLTEPAPGSIVLAFTTRSGFALWADWADVAKHFNEPIHLCLTSPLYPIKNHRAYGGLSPIHYNDYILRMLEHIVRNLAPGGSICLNLSNDVFEDNSPARSLYRERLIIALHDHLGLHKMDEFPWVDLSKAPGPIQWASKKRVQLNVAWEPIYWLTPYPNEVRANNLRVLRPHTDVHQKLIDAGGVKKAASYGDGANRLKPGSFGNDTPGTIPRNVLQYAHKCPSQAALRKELARRGLPMHGATMPLALAKFLVQFLTKKGDLVADINAGWLTTALAAEELGCRWFAVEKMLEYVGGSQLRFSDRDGFESYIELPDRG